jgi:hypothetical protein
VYIGALSGARRFSALFDLLLPEERKGKTKGGKTFICA